jgi:hypothetical protein
MSNDNHDMYFKFLYYRSLSHVSGCEIVISLIHISDLVACFVPGNNISGAEGVGLALQGEEGSKLGSTQRREEGSSQTGDNTLVPVGHTASGDAETLYNDLGYLREREKQLKTDLKDLKESSKTSTLKP